MISTAFNQIGRSKVTPAVERVKIVLRALFPGGIRVTFSDWEEVNLFALFCIIYMYSLHSASPVGVGELRITHHAAQSVSSRVRSGWS